MQLSVSTEDRGTALALLARAAGEQGNTGMFDRALAGYRQLLDNGSGRSMLFNPFTFHEIELRGLINTGRAADAVRLIHTGLPDATPVAAQWHIIERVTAGQVLLAEGQRNEAEQALRAALTAAEVTLLSHQIHRPIQNTTRVLSIAALIVAVLAALLATGSLLRKRCLT